MNMLPFYGKYLYGLLLIVGILLFSNIDCSGYQGGIGLSVGVGYSDNIQLESDAVSDMFVFWRSHLKINANDARNRFEGSGAIDYSYYIENDNDSRLERANIKVGYQRILSNNLQFEINNYFEVYQDGIEDLQSGELGRIISGSELNKRNVTNVSTTYRMNQWWTLDGNYQIFVNRVNSADRSNSLNHNMRLGSLYFLNKYFTANLDLYFQYTTYEDYTDQFLGGSGIGFQWQFSKTWAALSDFSFNMTRQINEEYVTQEGKEYNVYNALVGLKKDITNTIDITAMGGILYLDYIDQPTESTDEYSSKIYPTGSVTIDYKLNHLELSGYWKYTQSDYSQYGIDGGFTISNRLGARARWIISKKCNMNCSIDLVYDDYDMFGKTSDEQRREDNLSVYATTKINYEIYNNIQIFLDYRYISSEQQEGVSTNENRIMIGASINWDIFW